LLYNKKKSSPLVKTVEATGTSLHVITKFNEFEKNIFIKIKLNLGVWECILK
jgi:hypothetical protein